MACIMLLVSKGGLSYLKYYLPVHFDKEELEIELVELRISTFKKKKK